MISISLPAEMCQLEFVGKMEVGKLYNAILSSEGNRDVSIR